MEGLEDFIGACCIFLGGIVLGYFWHIGWMKLNE